MSSRRRPGNELGAGYPALMQLAAALEKAEEEFLALTNLPVLAHDDADDMTDLAELASIHQALRRLRVRAAVAIARGIENHLYPEKG